MVVLKDHSPDDVLPLDIRSAQQESLRYQVVPVVLYQCGMRDIFLCGEWKNQNSVHGNTDVSQLNQQTTKLTLCMLGRVPPPAQSHDIP